MRIYLRAAFLSLAVTVCALSGCALTPETAAEESAWLSLQTIDTAQTANIERTTGVQESESAWIIGREPKRKNVYAYMGSVAVLHISFALYMDNHYWPRWFRRLFEASTIADSANCIYGNYHLGIAAHF